MINKAILALTAAVALAGAASPAFAQTYTHHYYRTRNERLYNSRAQDSTFRGNSGADPSPYNPTSAGAGSLGYNQHNEVKN